jgi:hypothetical protein
MFVIIIKSNVIKPILIPKLNNTLKSKNQTNSKIFSIINLDSVTAKKVAINITELKIIINSIREDKIISFFENPKILNTKF